MPPDNGRNRAPQILGRGLALGAACLDQRLQVHPCSVRQHRPLLIPGGAKRPSSQTVQARTGPNMAKGEQRGNREAKKPKQEKPKATPAASPLPSQTRGPPPPGRAPERSRGPLLAIADGRQGAASLASQSAS